MTAYSQHRHLNYTAAQLFDLAADVERFPEFMPWVTQSRITRRKDHTIFVEMTIAAGPLRRRFSTIGVLERPRRIDITSSDPIFSHFEQRWRFEPEADGGARVDYQIDVELRSRLLQMLLGASFGDRAAATMAAFTRRAHQLYDAHSSQRRSGEG
jgi:coenzyme Q-binding protein COQ10